MKVFIIGNGESRKDFDLNLLRKSKCNIVVGCNALYRDFKPDVLVSVDRAMQEEIKQKCNFIKDIIYVRRNRYSEKLKGIELVIEHSTLMDTLKGLEFTTKETTFEDRGWASGPTATYSILKYVIPYHWFIQAIYLIGFDLGRLDNGRGNSMYKGTPCYIPINSPGATHNTSAKQLKTCFNLFPNMKFKRVIDGSSFPPEWLGVSNINNITYEEFHNELK